MFKWLNAALQEMHKFENKSNERENPFAPSSHCVILLAPHWLPYIGFNAHLSLYVLFIYLVDSVTKWFSGSIQLLWITIFSRLSVILLGVFDSCKHVHYWHD